MTPMPWPAPPETAVREVAGGRWSLRGGALAVAVLFLTGCDAFFHDGPAPGPVEMALTTAFAQGGPAASPQLAAAFDRTNRVAFRVEVEETGQVLVEESRPVTPDGEGIRLRFRVDLPSDRIRVRVAVTLLLDSQILFQGAFVTELVRGRPAQGEVPLVPRASRLEASGPGVIDGLARSVQLSARLLMATGDVIPGASFTWVSLDPGIVTVNSATGLATSVSEGTARVVALSQGVADTLTIRVEAVVASVEVVPAVASVVPGGQATFQAVARDSGGRPLIRSFVWSVSNPAVAAITPQGVATGIVVGETQVQARVGTVTGTALLRVAPPPPTVTTGDALNVSSFEATLTGTVNPRGAPAEAWFEFGSSPTLTTFQSTVRVSAGTGNQPVPFSRLVGNLQPRTTVYYRIAAANSGGESRGSIRSFVTEDLTIPLTPSNLAVEPIVDPLTEVFFGYRLSWASNGGSPERFELERRIYFENNFTLLQIVSAPLTDAADLTASLGSQYYYRVRACNAAGCSGYAGPVCAYYLSSC